MSYVGVPRGNYETFVPDGPWESGAPGWSTAPVPGWGNNPNQTLPHKLATAGIGCGCSVGADAPAPAPVMTTPSGSPLPVWPVFVMGGAMLTGMWLAYKLAMHSERKMTRR